MDMIQTILETVPPTLMHQFHREAVWTGCQNPLVLIWWNNMVLITLMKINKTENIGGCKVNKTVKIPILTCFVYFIVGWNVSLKMGLNNCFWGWISASKLGWFSAFFSHFLPFFSCYTRNYIYIIHFFYIFLYFL